MIWLLLFFGICIEVTGTFFLKKANGFENLKYLVLMFVCYLISMSSMSQVAKSIPLSTVYPIWTGLGTVLVALIGLFIFGENLSWLKLLFMTLIVVGVVGIYQT